MLDWIDALDLAYSILTEGQAVDADDLPVGAHGVLGTFIEGTPIAMHSVVGVAPGLGIQTDSKGGAFSLVSHSHNLEHYKTGLPGIKLYYKLD